MKKLLMLTTAFVLSFEVFAQNEGMGNHNGNSSGNYSFSGTEMLWGAILILLIVGIFVWVLDSRRNRK